MIESTERLTNEGFQIVFDEYKGAVVDVPTVCPQPGCGMDVTNYWDMHIVFHHPELRRIPVTGKEKKPRKKKR